MRGCGASRCEIRWARDAGHETLVRFSLPGSAVGRGGSVRPSKAMDSHNVVGRLGAGLMATALALVPATSISADVRPAPAASRPPLAGRIVGIDPGHNGLNYTSPAFLNRKVWNGREWEGCDTTGTQTAGGYTEARFNWNAAVYLRADLIRMGARVVDRKSV